MTRRNLYVFALWFPLMLLVAISIGEALLKKAGWHQMSPAAGYLLLSGAMGGIQYLLFAAAITWRFARMDVDFLQRLSWVLPIMFFPLCILGLWVFFETSLMHNRQALTADPKQVQQDMLAFCIRLGMYSGAAGYAYVAFTHALVRGLSSMGLLLEEKEAI